MDRPNYRQRLMLARREVLAADLEVKRLRLEIARAYDSGIGNAQLASLRGALSAAENALAVAQRAEQGLLAARRN